MEPLERFRLVSESFLRRPFGTRFIVEMGPGVDKSFEGASPAATRSLSPFGSLFLSQYISNIYYLMHCVLVFVYFNRWNVATDTEKNGE